MHRLTATDTPMVRYTRTIFPSYAISVSQKDIVVFYVSHNLNEIIKLNGEVYCFIPKFKTIKKIQNEELIDNRLKNLIMFGADSYE